MGVILLVNALFIETDSLEFFFATLISGILGGLTLYFRGQGFHLVSTDERDKTTYFGSPVLFHAV